MAAALLSLGTENDAAMGNNSNNSSESRSISSGLSRSNGSPSLSSKSTSSSDNDNSAAADKHAKKDEKNGSSSNGTDDPTSSKDSDSQDNIPFSILQKDLADGKKPVFKTKSYELFKYKRKRIFKCLNCHFTRKSQKMINQHFRDHHGLLNCMNCSSSSI